MRRNYCRSVISLQEPLPHSLWISLDLHGILAIVWTPVYSVVSICVCWPPKRRVYNITSSSLLHRKYLLLLCCLLKVSQYRLALIDTASVHIVKGISQLIHNRSSACWLELELERDAWLVSVVAASVVGPCRRARTHILPTGGNFLLLECASAGVCFCWSVLLLECASAGVCFCWSELLLAWLAYAAAGVAGGASAGGMLGSTRLLRGPD